MQLTELMAGLPVDTEQPFGKLKGKLAWPVQGRIAGDYGQPRGGGPVKWSGVLLEASQGTPVRAVYHGRVAFADWLPGLGLLIIVDHGDGYMSLYGHNEALLKEPGDWVAARRVDRAGRGHGRAVAAGALFRDSPQRRARESASVDREQARRVVERREPRGVACGVRDISAPDFRVQTAMLRCGCLRGG